MKKRIAYCVSDHTGVTIEAVARSMVSQFPAFEFSLITLPFIDTPEKVQAAMERISQTPDALVFSTLTDPVLRTQLRGCAATLLDLFDLFAPAIETALGQEATPSGGHTHGIAHNYDARMDAVNFSLALDDGLQTQHLDEADLILIGVSRVGKTPTALYLALQYGLRVANYPLTPEDLSQPKLPGVLLKHQPKLRALTLSAARLTAIRQARYPNSQYASLEQCRAELAAAEQQYATHHILTLDTTRMSVEEIAARLRDPL